MPAFATRFFSAAAKPPQKKELKHAAQSGAQVQEFLEPIFLKITYRKIKIYLPQS